MPSQITPRGQIGALLVRVEFWGKLQYEIYSDNKALHDLVSDFGRLASGSGYRLPGFVLKVSGCNVDR